MSTAKVTLEGQEFTLSAIPMRDMAKLWKKITVLISLVLAVLKAIGTVGKEMNLQGKEAPSVGQILSAIGSGAITEALESVLAKATEDQIEALMDILFFSVSRKHKALEQSTFDELVTMATVPGLVLAFLEAQGIKLAKDEKGKGSEPGEDQAAPTA